MKLKHIIIGAAVAIGAGVNVYIANDIRVQRNELSLLNLENIADADETNPGDVGGRVHTEAWAWLPNGSHITSSWDGSCTIERYYVCHKHTMCQTECQPGQTTTETSGC